MKNNFLVKIIFCSIMAALSFVCTTIEIPLVVNITLYGIPLIFVGVLYGPTYGALTGLVAGMLEQLKWGLSLQTFLWLLAPICWGGISGIINLLLKKEKFNKKNIILIIYLLVITITALFANITNSFALAVLGYSSSEINNLLLFVAYAVPRLISVPIHVALYVPICYLLCEKFKNIAFINL